MSNDLMLDVGQANELKLAFRRANYTNDDIKRLCEGNVLADVRNVLRGHSSITVVEHVIDCDVDPFVPDGWKVEEHQKGGSFQWDASKVKLWLASGQKNGSVLDGNKLIKDVAKKVPFNANVLDYLLANPHLIPEEWKGNRVFFWGTVYRNTNYFVCVRCLIYKDGKWGSRGCWYGSEFGENTPALVHAS